MCVVCLGAGGSGDLAGDIGGSEAAWRRWRWPRRRLPRPRLGVASGGLAPPPHGLPSSGGGWLPRWGGGSPAVPPRGRRGLGHRRQARRRCRRASLAPPFPLPALGRGCSAAASLFSPSRRVLSRCLCLPGSGRAGGACRASEGAGGGCCRACGARGSRAWLAEVLAAPAACRACLRGLAPACPSRTPGPRPLEVRGRGGRAPRGGACGDLSPVRPDPRLASLCRAAHGGPACPATSGPGRVCPVLASPLALLLQVPSAFRRGGLKTPGGLCPSTSGSGWWARGESGLGVVGLGRPRPAASPPGSAPSPWPIPPPPPFTSPASSLSPRPTGRGGGPRASSRPPALVLVTVAPGHPCGGGAVWGEGLCGVAPPPSVPRRAGWLAVAGRWRWFGVGVAGSWGREPPGRLWGASVRQARPVPKPIRPRRRPVVVSKSAGRPGAPPSP